MESVASLLTRNQWDTNAPNYEEIHRAWVSAQKKAIEEDPKILKAVTEQTWKGLDFKGFGERKGKGEQTNIG